MATIAEQLESIKSSKAAIKSAIQAKGVSCGEVLSDYAARIAAIPSIEQATLTITNATSTTESNGLYKWKIAFSVNGATTSPLSLPDEFLLDASDLYNNVVSTLGLSLLDLTSSEVIFASKINPFEVVCVIDGGKEPSEAYVNGILWYYPGEGEYIYGQKF